MKLCILLGLWTLALALVIIDSSLASACIYYMKGFDWGCGGTGNGMAMYMCRCANIDWVGSVTNCMVSQAADHAETVHAWKHVATRCLQKADIVYTVDELEAYSENATSYMEAPPTNVSERLYHPISVNVSAYEIYKTSFDDMNHHVFKCQWFGWGLVFFWGALIAYLTVSNMMWSFFRIHVTPRLIKQWYQRHLMQNTSLWGLSRADLIIMSLFTVQTACSTALSYTVSLPNMYINDVYFLTLDLIGYRSAIIAFSLMPVVYVFGLRNNPFCFLTGLPQAYFIKFHKFVGIIMAIEALIHSSIWTAYGIRSGGYALWAVDDYWRWGIVGTILIFLMLFQSVNFFRKLMYEFFLLFHKIFGWLFIVAMWYHCLTLGWMGWVYSLIAFTAYDRVVRLFKIFFVNRGYTQIQATVVDDKIVKLRIPKSELYDYFYKPGLHVFVSFYHWSIWYQCFQSHPFTIITSPVENGDHFVIYVRVKKGNTSTIAKLRGDEKGQILMWLLIEGPYGNGVPTFTDSELLVGIAGGLGICALLPAFYQNPKGSVLHWAVNNEADIEYLRADLDFLVARGTDVRVYYTRGKGEDDFSIQSGCKYVSYCAGRPDVDEWVKEAQETAALSKKSDVYILSCGPCAMDNNVQSSVCNRTIVGLALSIHYVRENYTW